MPPRKKAKSAAAPVSTPVTEDDYTVIDTSQEQESSAHYFLKNPWTDEQETSLFKGIIKWKPAGIHKHFRMIAISEHLRNHGYDPKVEKHTRIPGIWEKVRSMYNLEIIDEREDSFEFEEDAAERFLEFDLPEDEYGENMFLRGQRRPSEATSSPPRLNRSPSPQIFKKRKRGDTVIARNPTSTTEDIDEAAASPRPLQPIKRLGRPPGRGRPPSSSRLPSKDTTVPDEEEDEDEVGTEEAEDEEDDEADENDEDGSPSPKATRAAAREKANAVAKSRIRSRKSTRKK